MTADSQTFRRNLRKRAFGGLPSAGLSLSPFFGGATGMVAKQLNRRYIGISNPEFKLGGVGDLTIKSTTPSEKNAQPSRSLNKHIKMLESEQQATENSRQ